MLFEQGWKFGDYPGAGRDRLNGVTFMHEIYTHADPYHTGRATVPVLFDKHRNTIVNNESAEIVRMFNSSFGALADNTVDLYPADLTTQIDALNEHVYHSLNNGVDKAGLTSSRQAYEEACIAVFKTLDRLEDRLGSSNRRCVDRRSRLGNLASASSIPVRTSIHRPSFGAGCDLRSYLNSVSRLRITLRTVVRDTDNSRTISLIGRCRSKYARLIWPITSTPIILDALPGRQGPKGHCYTTSEGGQLWKRKRPLTGPTLHAILHPARDIDLVNDLLARPAETAWLEFKHNNSNPETMGELCSALSNSARLEGQSLAYIVWGVENSTHAVLGTGFEPLLLKIGNQELQLWLASMLKPSIAFSFRTITHPAGRVVLMEIPAATSTPVSFKGVAHIRIGSATPKLADYPERHQALIEALRPYAWEHNIAAQYVSSDDVLALIDYTQFFKLTKQPLPDNRVGIFERLEAEQLISKDVDEKWSISNLGAILFAADLTKFSAALARKAVRFTAYSGRNRATNVVHRIDGKRGYANGF